MKRVVCGRCKRDQFATSKCVCGAAINESKEVDAEHEINLMTFHMPKVCIDIIYIWFLQYYKDNDAIPADHVALAKRFEFIDPE